MVDWDLLKKKLMLLMTKSFRSILGVFFLFLIPTILSGQKSAQLSQFSKTDSSQNSSIITQKRAIVGSIDNYIESHNEQPTEKVFLHLDRSSYIQGDTIWFKAYLWSGYDQMPDTLSGVLYVDLINAEGKVLLKRKVPILNGTSYGDFSIDTIISPGKYSLRAYTRLMHELNAGEPFYQPIMINPANQNFQLVLIPTIIKQPGNDSIKIGMKFFEIEPSRNLNTNLGHIIKYSLNIGNYLLYSDSVLLTNDKEYFLKYNLAGIKSNDTLANLEISIRDTRLTYKKQIQIPLQENIDLQFFPEGGTLINGLESKIGFKAIGTDGFSRELAGEIETEDGKSIATFKSTHKGMGFFRLTPQNKDRYFAHFWYNGQKYIVPLPRAAQEGSTMSVKFLRNNNDPFLTLKHVPSGTTEPKYVIGSSYGRIWFSALVKTFTDSCVLRIPVELLPEGICKLTVLNSLFEPECERLIYIDKNLRIKIEITSDSSSYKARSKVTLQVKTTNLAGAPAQTDLSLAVIDRDQNIKDPDIHRISAYKLIESELHGYIEDVNSYFENDNYNKGNLDILLLTQGYRRFFPNNKNNKELKVNPDKNLEISGSIALNNNKKGDKKYNYKGVSLVLICGSKNSYLGLSKPDSLGKFRFQIPLLFGKTHAMLQATTSKKRPFDGNIFLDNTNTSLKFNSMPPLHYNLTSPSVEFISHLQAVKKTEISKFSLPGSMSKTLGEVIVSAKVKPKNWWRNYDKEAIKIANLDTLDPGGNRYRSLNDLLVEEFGARPYNANGLQTVLLPCIKTISNGWNPTYWFPIYLMDGKKYWNGEGFDFTPLQTLSSFHVDAIKRILVIPPMKSIVMNNAYEPIVGFPQYICQSMVIIETYSNNTYRGDPLGVKTFILDGLDVPRLFYSPRYDGPFKNSPVYDGRTTLYWTPSIRTDATGQSKVEFYTNDRNTTLEVIVNGIEVENGNSGEENAQINMNSKKQNDISNSR
jgi:hypothetical protein